MKATKKKPEEKNLGKKLREAEFRNILQKLKDGKTLSARESKIAEEFAAESEGKPKKLTQQQIAKAWGMTQPNVHKMVKAGMPLTSIEAAEAWRKEWLKTHGRGDTAPESIQDAKLRKTLLECEKIEFALSVDKNEYVKRTEIRESGIKIGSIFTAKMAALVNDASGALAGLDEATLRKKLNDRVQAILAEIKTELENV